MVNPWIKQSVAFLVTVVCGTILGLYFILWWIAEGEGTSISPPPTASAIGCYYFEGTIAEILQDSLAYDEPFFRVTIRFERLDPPPTGDRCMPAYRELDSILRRSDSLYMFCVDADSAADMARVGNLVIGAHGLMVIRGWAENEGYYLDSRYECE